ncbi:MAG TPA: M28 family peptidase [Chitinophagaceae bacterium]|nr:M28 family peptidase [Chitinophagaceae bacterium]
MKKTIFWVMLLAGYNSFAQDLAFGKKMVDTLTSPAFWGRGYTKDGMKKAADYLASQFQAYGIKPMQGSDFYQKFSYPVNTFPGKMEVNINDKDLTPGKDYIVAAESKGVKGKGELERVDSVQFVNKQNRVLVKLENKLTMEVTPEEANYTLILVDRNAFRETPGSIKVNIENDYVRNFKASNICGIVQGTVKPDSVILITAHYDHLGGMGKDTYFPGANDNASGVSLLLNLAHYYATHPQPYSIGFILFAGEEAGLIGSKYFTEHPLVPLRNIRFLINTDLAGTGDEGITVVNATEYPKEFAMMNAVNDENKLLVKINSRGKAANSDHYFFTEKGVPSFFFYTMGGIKAYHDVFDKAETLPLNEHEDLFKLVVKFNEKLMGK